MSLKVIKSLINEEKCEPGGLFAPKYFNLHVISGIYAEHNS